MPRAWSWRLSDRTAAGRGDPRGAARAVDVAGGAVLLADGQRLVADAVVLAPGNFPPAPLRGIEPKRSAISGSMIPGAARSRGLGRTTVVFLVGTGLTAVGRRADARGDRLPGRIVALSRRGLAPRVHGLREPMSPRARIWCPPASRCCAGCARAREVGWRSAVQELRRSRNGSGEKRTWTSAAASCAICAPGGTCTGTSSRPAVGATIELMQAEARLAVAAGRLRS